LWSGYDRPVPDYANARFILALNAHLESGHFFNPMAQRISEGLSRGAKMAVVDPRLSNTASHAHFWMPCKPGTEAALILALAKVVLDEGLVDRAYVERWVNWREFLEGTEARRHEGTKGIAEETERRRDVETKWEEDATRRVGSAHQSDGRTTPDMVGRDHPTSNPPTVDDFFVALKQLYADFTPEFAEAECGIPAKTIVEVGRSIGQAGSRFCSHVWRGAASAHLGGWQVSRCLMLLHAMTGSYGTEGGCLPNAWSKYKASLINVPPPQNHWNELLHARVQPGVDVSGRVHVD
jgi:anaerobic selenocysteine-containing dehydrogenase